MSSTPVMIFTLTITMFLLHHCDCHITASGGGGDGGDIHLVEELEADHKTMKQKLSHFRLYWHDVINSTTPSSITVVKPVTKTGFGQVNMIDNALTLGPELSSRLVGKAQGFYALASQEQVDLLMAMNFYFSYGKYNGSSITILGRNPVFNDVREMPVIGGSGLFRFARGYVQARTHALDLKTGDATVEYTIYVLHF